MAIKRSCADSDAHGGGRDVWIVGRRCGDDRGYGGRDRYRKPYADYDTRVGSRGVKACRGAQGESGNKGSGVTHCQLQRN
jgi:hypothetical protein